MAGLYLPSMDSTAEVRPERASRKKGCLVLVLVALGLAAGAFWEIGEPGRRAQRNFAAIHPGMDALEIEPLLTGRHYCIYQIQRPDGWEIVTRENFRQLITAPPGREPVKLRLMLTFMGMSPGRVSFSVDVGGDGRVKKTNKPYNWD